MSAKKWAVGSGKWAVDGGRWLSRAAIALVLKPHSTLPTAHRPPPTARSFTSPRGMSLLEVLAAIGVLSIGLLGLAALLPIGRYTIAEANKADHAGNCGRAALRAVVVRNMLDSSKWTVRPAPGPAFVIDPLGVTNGKGTFGGRLQRMSLINAAQDDFKFKDDLIVQLPEGMEKPTVAPDYKGDYSWFLTAVPNPNNPPPPNNPTQFTVSAVVCFKRGDFTETTAGITFSDLGYGGGSVTLINPSAPFEVKENDWIALVGRNPAKPIPMICRWYRVAAMGDDGLNMTLTGPDWDTSYTTTAVALGQSVVGVYTTMVEVPTDPAWKN